MASEPQKPISNHHLPLSQSQCRGNCRCNGGGGAPQQQMVYQQQPPQVVYQAAPPQQVIYQQAPPPHVIYQQQSPPQQQQQPQYGGQQVQPAKVYGGKQVAQVYGGAPLQLAAYPPPPPPPTIHAFFGAIANVTTIAAELGTWSMLAETTTFGVDPCPHLSKGLCIVYDPGNGVLAQVGCGQGETLKLPASATVKLAVWGAFADVSGAAASYARSPAFGLQATAAFLRIADPAPGCPKKLYVHLFGGAMAMDRVGSTGEGHGLTVDWQ